MKQFFALMLILTLLWPQTLRAHDMKGMDMSPPQKPAIATGSKIGGPFSLTDRDGKTVTDKDFGKTKIIYFGYTSCPDTCPLELHKIAQAVQKLGDKAGKVQVIFITTDPQRDKPAVLKDYLSSFKPVAITGLTGTPDQIKAVEKEYGVYAQKQNSDTMSDYTVDHSSVIYLVGPDNQLLDMYGNDTKPDDLAAAIQSKI